MFKVFPMATSYTRKCSGTCQNRQALCKRSFFVVNESCRGFFILEVLVALVVLSIASLIVAWYQGHTAIAYHDAQRRMAALSSVQRVVARIEQNSSQTDLHGSLQEDGYAVSWQAEPFAGLSEGALLALGLEKKKVPPLYRVTVTASWAQSRGHQQEIKLHTLVSMRHRERRL